MESVLGRYRNLIILVGVLFLQVLGLAVQVKRNAENESSRLIRIWTVSAVTPFEKTLVWIQTSTGNIWHNYFYLRGVRAENRELKAEIERLRLQQVRLTEDAEQARRLQALLAFKEQFISQTVAAQVIGSSGSEQSRSVYIDKGTREGIKPDMAVITADGVVGKVLRVFHSTSLVLLIDDQSSGVGALLEKSRVQGVLKGTPSGEVILEKVTSDELVQAGEPVLTSGGDRIFPKGLRVGTVSKISSGADLFLNIRVKPAANLSKLEEVLVVTKVEEKEIAPSQNSTMRAADILAQRLPSVPDKPAVEDANKNAANKPANSLKAPGSAGAQTKPAPANSSANPGAETAAKPTNPPNATSAGGPRKPAPPSGVGGPVDSGTQIKYGSQVPPATARPANGAAATVKPATAQKPAPPVVKAVEKTAKPAALPKPKPPQTGNDESQPDQAKPALPDQASPTESKPAQPKPDQPKVDQPPPQDSPQ